jgi:hypothetical protein
MSIANASKRQTAGPDAAGAGAGDW